MAFPIAAAGLALQGAGTAGSLAGLYYQNKWARKNFDQNKREYEEQMAEYRDDKKRMLEAQKLADLFTNSSWVGDKDKERLEQNYGYYLRNLRK